MVKHSWLYNKMADLPQQADMFGPPHPTYTPENARDETQGRLFDAVERGRAAGKRRVLGARVNWPSGDEARTLWQDAEAQELQAFREGYAKGYKEAS